MKDSKDIQKILDDIKGDIIVFMENNYSFSIDDFYDTVFDKKLIHELNRKYGLNKKELEMYDNIICSELLSRHAMWDLADIQDNCFEYILDLIDCYR